LIPGDGIGPEISEAVKRIFAAAKVRAKSVNILII
jgi:isocitrate/isopropylmalate dehydrogenase